MKKLSISLMVAASLVAVSFGAAFTIPFEPEHSIKDVMKAAHKDGLMKKVSEGKGTQEDKEKLLSLYLDLYEGKPPMGDASSWREKTGSVVVAAARVVLKKDGSEAKLKDAVNCGACHKAHKK
jgi:hypothetical protein